MANCKTLKTHYTIPEVAALIGFRYQRARDLILTGACGPVEQDGRHMVVRRVMVRAYLKKLQRQTGRRG